MRPRKSPTKSTSSNSVLSKVRSTEQVSVSPSRLRHVMAPPNTMCEFAPHKFEFVVHDPTFYGFRTRAHRS